MSEFVLTAALSRLMCEQRNDMDWKVIGALCQLSPSVCEKRFAEMETLVRDVQNTLACDDKLKQKTLPNSNTKADELVKHQKRSETKKGDNDVVIHVFDENKNARQDFSCPRDLLVREVAYFDSVLQNTSRDTPTSELDISVHCDIFVFDWLMKFVKSRPLHEGESPSHFLSSDNEAGPHLDRSNVVSILIASDYLKMNSLVDICLRFFRDNLESIVNSPTNLTCINDSLVSRLASLLTHNEIDDLKDKRDKIRSRLFLKRIELLFRSNCDLEDSPENAATLFRCGLCNLVLTKSLDSKLPCVPERAIVDEYGCLRYLHEADPSFNIMGYLSDLKAELKTWRDVYFKLWATINYLRCSKCSRFFTLSELGQCRYHRDDVGRTAHETPSSGTHSCCGREVVRFDVFLTAGGCAMYDHIPLKTASNKQLVEKLWTDTQRRRDLICFPAASVQLSKISLAMRAGSRPATRSLFEKQNALVDEYLRRERGQFQHLERIDLAKSADFVPEDFNRELNAASGSEAGLSLAAAVEKLERDAGAAKGSRKSNNKNVWDTTRSQRANQDFQRQDDTRRLRKLVQDLVNLRTKKEKENVGQKDRDKSTIAGGRIIKEFSGGLYARIEAQWRLRFTAASSATERASLSSASTSVASSSALQSRASTANTSLTRAKIRPSAVISPKVDS